ncbi:hypothetical protein ABMA79_12115 [Halobacteriovorax sp. HFRX-2_2]|uniref:hypothetical protein n=1 Tax=unclassified Halobacteriovorax TaxID=2639665 RepID=UPI0037135D89
MSQNKILISLSAVFIIIIAVAIGFGKYKEYVDTQLLDLNIFKDSDENQIADYAQRPLEELLKEASTMDISAESKLLLKSSLKKVIASIEDLYTIDNEQTNTDSVKALRCFYRELMYMQKEYQLDMYSLMPLKKQWDEIQYPNGASKTFLQKKIGRIGVKAKINNQFCFNHGFASKLRAEPESKNFKGLFNGLNILKRVL